MTDTAESCEAEEARLAHFNVFREGTSADERDWAAFSQFEQAASDGAFNAVVSRPTLFEDRQAAKREQRELEVQMSQMFFRALPRICIGTLLSYAGGIGLAIQFNIMEAEPEGLDNVTSLGSWNASCDRPEEALRAHADSQGKSGDG